MNTLTSVAPTRAHRTPRVQSTGRDDRRVIGSHHAAALAELHLGRREVAGRDAAAVLAVLRDCTHVVSEGGSVPGRARVCPGDLTGAYTIG